MKKEGVTTEATGLPKIPDIINHSPKCIRVQEVRYSVEFPAPPLIIIVNDESVESKSKWQRQWLFLSRLHRVDIPGKFVFYFHTLGEGLTYTSFPECKYNDLRE